jgi:hypothetical protein
VDDGVKKVFASFSLLELTTKKLTITTNAMAPNPTPTPTPAAAPALRPLDEFWLEEEAGVDADVVDELPLEVEEIVLVGAEGYVGVAVTGRRCDEQ